MTTDDYGVPVNFFGAHPEEFFGGLGRIVALSALLENKLLTLVEVLDDCTPDSLRFLSMNQLISRGRNHLDALGPRLGARLKGFLEDVETAVATRNDIVHSVWPAQDSCILFGWRPNRDKRRQDGSSDTVTMSLEDLKAYIRNLVALVQECPRLWTDIAIARRVGAKDWPPS